MRRLASPSRKKLLRYLETDDAQGFADHCLELIHVPYDLSSFFDGAEEAYSDFAIHGATRLAQAQQGFLYLATNPVYGRDVYKIGKTRKAPAQRLQSLESAGVLGEFILVAAWPSLDLDRTERRAHARFSDCRVDGEFFQAHYSSLIEGLEQILAEEKTAQQTFFDLLVARH